MRGKRKENIVAIRWSSTAAAVGEGEGGKRGKSRKRGGVVGDRREAISGALSQVIFQVHF